jgi:hypothetical protein
MGVVQVLSPRSDKPRWVAPHDGIFRNVPRHHAAREYDGAPTNAYTGHDQGVRKNDRVGFDCDAIAETSEAGVVQPVPGGIDANTVTDHDAVTNFDATACIEEALKVHGTAVTQPETPGAGESAAVVNCAAPPNLRASKRQPRNAQLVAGQYTQDSVKDPNQQKLKLYRES